MTSSLNRMMTEARFMPLADIFIGAIACILIMIIISKKAKVEVNETPQADLIFECIEEPFFPGDKSDIKRLVFSQLHPAPLKKNSFNEGNFEKKLRVASLTNRLSIRVLLQANFDAKRCIRATKYIISKHNKQYDVAKNKDAPQSYLLLDIARENAEILSTN